MPPEKPRVHPSESPLVSLLHPLSPTSCFPEHPQHILLCIPGSVPLFSPALFSVHPPCRRPIPHSISRCIPGVSPVSLPRLPTASLGPSPVSPPSFPLPVPPPAAAAPAPPRPGASPGASPARRGGGAARGPGAAPVWRRRRPGPAMAKQYDVLFRLLLLGDSGVGKTCLLCRFTDNQFHPAHISTIGVDFKMKTIEVDGIKVRIQIWDTAGQERYQTITKQYYRRAQGIFLVYDISSERSYQHIVKWASDVDEYAPDGVQKILIGNKADEEHKRQVPKEQGLQLAKEYGMDFYETSACSNLNIKESFTRLTELVLQAHRKELDELRGPPRAPTLARLEEDEQQPLGSEDTPKTCWC
ncbi:ras-related protein Rab-15 [Sylvia borin]